MLQNFSNSVFVPRIDPVNSLERKAINRELETELGRPIATPGFALYN